MATSTPTPTPSVTVGTARRGFTLVELLVVIGIIALLISILLPSLQSARGNAIQVACLARAREVSNGWQLFAAENQGRLITEQVAKITPPPPWLQWGASVQGSWPAQVRPYLGAEGPQSNTDPFEFLACPALPAEEGSVYELANHADSHYALNMNLRGTNIHEVGYTGPFNWKPKKFVNIEGSSEVALLLDAVMNVNNAGVMTGTARNVWPETFTPSHVKYPGSIAPHTEFGEKLSVVYADGHAAPIHRDEVPNFDEAEIVDASGDADPHGTKFWYGKRNPSVFQGS